MKISEYGKLVRKARIDAGVTMLDMARSIGVARISVLRKLVRRKYLRIFSRRLKNSSLHGG